MNENQIKKIVTSSKLKTSDDFTDRLMNKIELQEHEETINIWSFKKVLAAVAIISLMISFGGFKFMNLLNEIPYLKFGSAKTLLLVLISIGLFSAINYLIKLHQAFERPERKIKG